MAKNKAIAEKVEEIMRSKEVEKAIDAAADKAAEEIKDVAVEAIASALDEDVQTASEPEVPQPEVVVPSSPKPEQPTSQPTPVQENAEEPKRKRIMVDEEMWHRMVQCMVIGQPHNYLGIPGVLRFGEMRGAKTYDEAQALWQETQEFIRG